MSMRSDPELIEFFARQSQNKKLLFYDRVSGSCFSGPVAGRVSVREEAESKNQVEEESTPLV